MTADVLAELADPELSVIWEPSYNVRVERELWCSVMRHQARLGLPIPAGAIRSSEALVDPPPGTLELIDRRERVTRHDLKARLEIYCEQAGHEYHHLGMTSADVVDNVTQIRMARSMDWLAGAHGVSLPVRQRYTMRGLKGAVGTSQDQLDLLRSPEAVLDLDCSVAADFGFAHTMGSVGQVYPRSQDLWVLSELTSAVAARGGAVALLAGFQSMAAGYAGQQWNEGDVSTSVVRRYCLPGAWRAASVALRG